MPPSPPPARGVGGVDHVVASGVADSNRMGIMGWSYEGYMTSFTITQTNRFKAASVGAGVANLMSFTGTTDVSGFMPDCFRGDPWDDLEPYRARSAMFHVKNVVTPTLIQHGEEDARVPASQGYELYNGLKRQGKTVKMIVLSAPASWRERAAPDDRRGTPHPRLGRSIPAWPRCDMGPVRASRGSRRAFQHGPEFRE